MDLLAFIHVADPTKVRVVERERAKGEVKLMDSIVGRVVSLLPVAPAHAESELEASVNKLFDEGGSADQRNSATGDTHRKKRPAVANSSELLVTSLLNVEAGVKAVVTLPFVTSSVFATPEREDGNLTDLITEANLHTIGPAKRSVVPLLVIIEAAITTAIAGIPSAPILK
nr:hypothetical protein [Tanacetum cinerariifolium]